MHVVSSSKLIHYFLFYNLNFDITFWLGAYYSMLAPGLQNVNPALRMCDGSIIPLHRANRSTRYQSKIGRRPRGDVSAGSPTFVVSFSSSADDFRIALRGSS